MEKKSTKKAVTAPPKAPETKAKKPATKGPGANLGNFLHPKKGKK